MSIQHLHAERQCESPVNWQASEVLSSKSWAYAETVSAGREELARIALRAFVAIRSICTLA